MYVLASFGVPYYAYLWDGYLKDNINNRLYGVRAGFLDDRIAADAQSRRSVRSDYRKQQATSTSRCSRPIRFRRVSASPGTSRATARRSSAATTAGTTTGRNRATTICSIRRYRRFYGAYIDANLQYHGRAVPDHDPGTNRTMDPDIKHPRMRQAIVGVERELVRGLSVGATGIWRKNDQFIDDVLHTPLSEFSTSTLRDPGLDGVAGHGGRRDGTGDAVRPVHRSDGKPVPDHQP